MAQPPHAPENDVLNAHWEPCAIAQVEELALTVFGKVGVAKRLSSERDETFQLATDDGNFTLKIANPVEDVLSLAFQADVLLHLAKTTLLVPVPRLVPTLDGQASFALPVPDGSRVVQLLTYLEGELMGATPASAKQCHALGLALGSLSAGLAGATARPPAGKLLWDLSHFADLASLLGFVDAARRPVIQRVLDDFSGRVLPGLGDLPAQVIHNDFNPYNILVDPQRPDAVVGIIDFGDMVHGPRVNDLAVAAAYHLSGEDWAEKLSALLRGFGAVVPLTPAETEVLPTLIAARLAMTMIITEWRASLRPDESAYILRNHRSACLGLAHLSEAPEADLRQLIHDSCKA
ncbi:phosphotransferase [Aureimonas sp. SA4125]|uniref:phosphotransferase n=1 Tax=Aureimonas sp. SA4125 TaxID=2826993 RepID=UPI001CC480E6|nr:phosphotransferase [Aureimonas sp. SA4125]BDA87117.1 phosphotransferase [Aureimonas sp. SA4125]